MSTGLLFDASIWAAQSGSFTQYFAQMPFRESPYAPLKGIIPISGDEAAIRKHYRFTYDKLGRPIEVAFMQGNQVLPLNISRNAITHAPVTRIKYEQNKEIRSFYNQFNQPTTANGVFKEKFDINAHGYRTQLRFYDSENNQIESNWGIYSYQWQVDPKGTVTEQRLNKAGEAEMLRPGFDFFCLKLHYNSEGWLAMMENYGKHCETLTLNSQNGAQDKLEYLANGVIQKWNVYDHKGQRSEGNGPKVATGVMIADEFGNTVRQYYLDRNGEPMTNAYGWTDSRATFDIHGNMTSRFNFDSKNKLSNNKQLGYAGYKITYDINGHNRLTISYFDEQNKATSHLERGFHQLATSYDQHGRITSHKFTDLQGNLVNRKDNCIASIRYRYNDQNKRIETIRLNANRKIITGCTKTG